MWRSRKHNLKRRMVSGILACLLVATSLTNTVGVISAFAAQGTDAPRVSYKYDDLKNDRGDLDKLVQINVQAENESFLPGSEMVLKVYVQNLSGQYLTGGSLKWNGKGLEEAGFLDEEEEDVFNGPGWDNGGSGDSAGSDTTGGQDGGLMEELGSFSVTGLRKSVALRVDDTNPADGTDGEEGLAPQEKPEAIGGMDFTEITEIQDNEEDDSDEPETDEEGRRIKGIELAPGEVYETRFYGTVEELESIVTRKVTFEFMAGVDGNDQKLAQDKAEFTYNTGMALVLPVEFEDGPALMTNELNTLYIRTRFEDEKILDEYTWDVTDGDGDEATPADAQRHEITVATMSNGDGDNTEGTTPANMKYSIVTYGAKLLGIEAWRDEDKSDWGEVATGVSFRVADGTEPGVYFGQVTTSIRRDGKSYKTAQGFHFFVLGDGQIVLKGNVGGAEIQVKGDRESFPEGDMLSLKVTEVPEEKMGLVQEAMAQKADELGVSVDKMMAVDIKVIADGIEQELRGGVEVTFSNLQMQSLDGSLDSDELADADSAEADDAAEAEEFEEISNHSVFGLRKAAAQNDDTAQEENPSADDLAVDDSQAEGADESNEESSLAVWHFDEDNSAIDEMDSDVNDDGDVVMTTEHFSVFIVVDMGQLGGNITLRIEHYGQNIKTIDLENRKTNSQELLYDSAPKDGKRYGFYTRDGVYDRRTMEVANDRYSGSLYSTDTIVLPNKKEYNSIEKLSKVCSVEEKERNYKVVKVKVGDKEYSVGRDNNDRITYLIDNDGNQVNKLTLTNNTTIQFVYEERIGSYDQPVIFYDHNVSDGGVAEGSTGTNAKSNFNYKGSTEGKWYIQAGQWSSGNHSEYAKHHVPTGSGFTRVNESLVSDIGKLNAGNRYGESKMEAIQKVGPNNPVVKPTYYDTVSAANKNNYNTSPAMVVKGIVKGLDENGNIEYADFIADPGFFGENPNNRGVKKFDDYTLRFNKAGDTYTLSKVLDETDTVVCAGYNEMGLEYIKSNTQALVSSSNSRIFSNEFWPLDQVSYSGMDAKNNGQSDDGTKGVHNWHFGMRYNFTFHVGDYEGPINYYFRGDDDFWLFLDGELIVDIGGIHSAVGEAVDLRQLLTDKNGVIDKEKEHQISVFYMERGGFGSCCYMQFTVPNCKPIKDPSLPQTTVTVKKEWDDFSNPYRPEKIKVTLFQKAEGMEESINKGDAILSEENGWTHQWTDLPTHWDLTDEQRVPCYYEVMEEVPEGYDMSTRKSADGWFITIKNKLNPVKVKVTKTWNDGDNECGNRPESLKFQLYVGEGENAKIFPGEQGVITLPNDKGEWIGTFENLPKYTYEKGSDGKYETEDIKDENGNVIGKKVKGTPITYTVREVGNVNGIKTIIQKESSLLLDGQNYNVSYKVSYDDNGLTTAESNDKFVAHTIVTNTHKHALKVIKNWNGPGAGENKEAPYVCLYEVNADQSLTRKDGEIHQLAMEEGVLTTKYDGLDPDKTYTVRELEVVENPADSRPEGIFEAPIGNTTMYFKEVGPNEFYETNYQVSYDGPRNDGSYSCKQIVTINNSLRTAKVRVAKWIANWDEVLDVNDLALDDFIIKVTRQTPTSTDNVADEFKNAFETGLVLQHAGKTEQENPNDNGKVDPAKISGYIEVLVQEGGDSFKVEETFPKEYEELGVIYIPHYQNNPLHIEANANGEYEINGLPNGVVTVNPGDDGLIVVYNKFTHKDYFHDDARVTNLFRGGQFSKSEVVSLVVPMGAFLAEETKNNPERKYQDEERFM